jgi:hypothetical protein
VGERQRDLWDKVQIVLGPVGGLLTALAVVWIGFLTNRHLTSRQDADARERLYSELMSRREDSESALRKDMFASIITSFLSKSDSRSAGSGEELEARVLNLELLSYNFHESLNLTPLFLHLVRAIHEAPITREARLQFLDRLRRMAAEINRREGDLLESAGDSREWDVNLDSVPRDEGPSLQLDDATLTVDTITRVFRVSAVGVDPAREELKLRVEVITGDPSADTRSQQTTFNVGFFDFPMVDNTRLSRDQRYAVVLQQFDASHARIRLLYFPGSRASLRERPYYEEILENLRRQTPGM